MVADIQLGAVSLPGDDEGPFPVSQITSYGAAADAVVLWPYGMHGSLPVDSYAVSFAINGQQENRIVMGYRPDLRPKSMIEGEIAFGNFVRKSTVFFNDAGDIVVNCENDEQVTIKGASTVNITGDASVTVGGSAVVDVTGNTTLTTPTFTVDGNLVVTGTGAINGAATMGAGLGVTGASTLQAITSNGTNVGDTHVHSGVTSGPSNTGAPI